MLVGGSKGDGALASNGVDLAGVALQTRAEIVIRASRYVLVEDRRDG